MGGNACSNRVDFRTRSYEEICQEVETNLKLSDLNWTQYLEALAQHTVKTDTFTTPEIMHTLLKLGMCPEYRGDIIRLRSIIDYIVNSKNQIKNFQYFGLFYCQGNIEEKFNYLWYSLGGKADGTGGINCDVAENAAAFLIHVAGVLIPSVVENAEKNKSINLLESLNSRFEGDVACKWLEGIELGEEISKTKLYDWAVNSKQFTPTRARKITLEFAKKYNAQLQYAENESALKLSKMMAAD